MIEYSVLIGLVTATVIFSIVIVGAWVLGEWQSFQTALGLGT